MFGSIIITSTWGLILFIVLAALNPPQPAPTITTFPAFLAFEEAISINCNFHKPYIELGILYGEKGQVDKSIKFLSKALSIKKKFIQNYFVEFIIFFIQGAF